MPEDISIEQKRTAKNASAVPKAAPAVQKNPAAAAAAAKTKKNKRAFIEKRGSAAPVLRFFLWQGWKNFFGVI